MRRRRPHPRRVAAARRARLQRGVARRHRPLHARRVRVLVVVGVATAAIRVGTDSTGTQIARHVVGAERAAMADLGLGGPRVVHAVLTDAVQRVVYDYLVRGNFPTRSPVGGATVAIIDGGMGELVVAGSDGTCAGVVVLEARPPTPVLGIDQPGTRPVALPRQLPCSALAVRRATGS